MAKRRGFFAEIQHQQRLAEQQEQRRQREAARASAAASREAERARKAEERAAAQAQRAAEAELKRVEKKLKEAHIAAMEAETEKLNAQLAAMTDEIEGILAWTLDFDDFVDLETLRQTPEHPPFPHADLENPIPPPTPLQAPEEPKFVDPGPPTGWFFRQKRHAKAVAEAQEAYNRAMESWRADVETNRAHQDAAQAEHARAEQERLDRLENARQQYRKECAEREEQVAEHNRAVDTLIANLGYGDVDAVHEYISIVVANSVYPDSFQVQHDFEFDPSTAELRMKVIAPPPSSIPEIKTHKYSKSGDEITPVALPKKACKDRYSAAIEQVSLRTLHEMFEADRRALIKSISLEVGTETTAPATGNDAYIPFVAVAADRDGFLKINLAAVVPSATLAHLGAAVSKDPYGLVAVSSGGVRRA